MQRERNETKKSKYKMLIFRCKIEKLIDLPKKLKKALRLNFSKVLRLIRSISLVSYSM